MKSCIMISIILAATHDLEAGVTLLAIEHMVLRFLRKAKILTPSSLILKAIKQFMALRPRILREMFQ